MGGESDRDTDTDSDADPPLTSCPGRLEPVAPMGLEVVVGEGTPESCTEAALHEAAGRINGADGGGTLTFDCGGEHTIELTRSLYLSSDAIVDGGAFELQE